MAASLCPIHHAYDANGKFVVSTWTVQYFLPHGQCGTPVLFGDLLQRWVELLRPILSLAQGTVSFKRHCGKLSGHLRCAANSDKLLGLLACMQTIIACCLNFKRSFIII